MTSTASSTATRGPIGVRALGRLAAAGTVPYLALKLLRLGVQAVDAALAGAGAAGVVALVRGRSTGRRAAVAPRGPAPPRRSRGASTPW